MPLPSCGLPCPAPQGRLWSSLASPQLGSTTSSSSPPNLVPTAASFAIGPAGCKVAFRQVQARSSSESHKQRPRKHIRFHNFQKNSFHREVFLCFISQSRVHPCRKDTSSSQLSRPAVPRARRIIIPEQSKQRNSSKHRELQSSCPMPHAITAELLDTAGPIRPRPAEPHRSQLLWHHCRNVPGTAVCL